MVGTVPVPERLSLRRAPRESTPIRYFSWKNEDPTYAGGARLFSVRVEDDESDVGDEVAFVVGVVSLAPIDGRQHLVLCIASHGVRPPCVHHEMRSGSLTAKRNDTGRWVEDAAMVHGVGRLSTFEIVGNANAVNLAGQELNGRCSREYVDK